MMAKSKLPDLNELAKDGLLMSGDDERLRIKRLLTGIPQLDVILGGGFPYGRMVMLVGPESTGKTLISQYAVAAQQKSEKRPHALLIDAERSFDQDWWAASGVDVSELLVSLPPTAEDAIDVMHAAFEHDAKLGIVVLDSVAALTPRPTLDEPADQKFMGLLANLVTRMLQVVMPLNKQAIFIVINQMRENLRGHEEIYPGGRALRHQSHIILRTRREGWILDKEERIGFTMEVACRKNKTAIPLGVATIPFRFRGQLDLVQSYIDEAIHRGIIEEALPWYRWGGKKFMGKNNLRQHFLEEPQALEILKQQTKDGV